MAGLESLFSNIEEQKKEIETSLNQVNLNRNEILSKYDFSFGEEIVTNETINFLKDQTIRIHNLSNNFYTDLGKVFKETQDQLLSDGIFVKWIENIGFKKSNVYRYISRYNFIASLSVEKKERAEALPLTISYEILRDIYSEEVKEKVLSGEIVKVDELKKLSTKKETPIDTKDVPNILILNEVKEIIDLLAEKENRLKTVVSSEILHKIRKAKNIIKEL